MRQVHIAGMIRIGCLVLAAAGLASPVMAAPKNIKKCTTISASGSYVLSGPITAVGDCILVGADFVTINFNGFPLTGNGTGSAVKSAGGNRQGIRLANGTIKGFVTGVDFGSTGTKITVENMHIIGNSNVGVGANEQSIVKDCVASGNGDGINVGSRSVVTGNDSSNNTASGFVVSVGSTIIGNTAGLNGNNGIAAGGSSTVLNNTAQANSNFGIAVTCPSNVIGNTANLNGTNLLLSGAGCNNSNNVAP
jgi:hypothetical protein